MSNALMTGLATVDKSLRYLQSYPQVLQKLEAASDGAKRDRLGIFE
jgi:staphylococcal nuclease domain-containing protein 1